MTTAERYRPGAGFILLLAFVLLTGLMLAWAFGNTRIESTISLEEAGLKQLYRQQADEALDLFRQSALVDTDKQHHIMRYRDSLRLAIESDNAVMAAFFLDELLVESPELVGRTEILGLLAIQTSEETVIELLVGLAQVERIDKAQIKQAVSDYIGSMDEQSRPGFVHKLNRAMQAGSAQRAAAS